MRDAGCDLFPERDAFSYVKALPVKHPVIERHLRECMALLCTAYTFSWSRWNASRNSREIVIQFKEIHGCVAKEVKHLIILSLLRNNTIMCWKLILFKTNRNSNFVSYLLSLICFLFIS